MTATHHHPPRTQPRTQQPRRMLRTVRPFTRAPRKPFSRHTPPSCVGAPHRQQGWCVHAMQMGHGHDWLPYTAMAAAGAPPRKTYKWWRGVHRGQLVLLCVHACRHACRCCGCMHSPQAQTALQGSATHPHVYQVPSQPTLKAREVCSPQHHCNTAS
jgi:hypothetical protein